MCNTIHIGTVEPTYKIRNIAMYSRNSLGQFAKRSRKYVLVVIVLALVCLATYPAFMSWMEENLKATVSYQAEAMVIEVDKSDEKLAEKLLVEKWKVVDDLERCECGGHTWDEGFFRMDSNDKYSYGCMQFQADTVVHYAKKLWGKVLTLAEAKILALTRDDARQLAFDVIFKTENGVAKDWVICSRNYNLQSRVDIIKNIEK